MVLIKGVSLPPLSSEIVLLVRVVGGVDEITTVPLGPLPCGWSRPKLMSAVVVIVSGRSTVIDPCALDCALDGAVCPISGAVAIRPSRPNEAARRIMAGWYRR